MHVRDRVLTGVADDLKRVRAYDRSRILDEIEEQLARKLIEKRRKQKTVSVSEMRKLTRTARRKKRPL